MTQAETANGPDIEFIKNELMRLGVKLDALPQLYVLRPEYDSWRASTDRRLDTVEAEARAARSWEGEEHTRITTQVVESERRIIERIDIKDTAQSQEVKDVKKDAQAYKVMLLLAFITIIVAPTLFLVVNYLLGKH